MNKKTNIKAQRRKKELRKWQRMKLGMRKESNKTRCQE
jgi:hypothetical protein